MYEVNGWISSTQEKLLYNIQELLIKQNNLLESIVSNKIETENNAIKRGVKKDDDREVQKNKKHNTSKRNINSAK